MTENEKKLFIALARIIASLPTKVGSHGTCSVCGGDGYHFGQGERCREDCAADNIHELIYAVEEEGIKDGS